MVRRGDHTIKTRRTDRLLRHTLSTFDIALGPFTLHRIIGRGAMGDVWSGEHRGQQVPVAVKVLGRSGTWSAEDIERFRSEVKAVARLNHPGIVMVLDYGTITREVTDASGGLLTHGSPYLAMELAQYGALDRLTEPLDWPELKQLLLHLLEGLGHAHARGVIHRDIKPANILLTTQKDWTHHLKLTDFGIAQAQHDSAVRTDQKERSVGTPTYMSPEQFEGHWRDYGPWTDLYSLGVMAWELATGYPPFEGDSFVVFAYKHLKAKPPALPEERSGAFPEGFERWLWRLMEKEPMKRFQRAADAAWALRQLDEDDDDDVIDMAHALTAPSIGHWSVQTAPDQPNAVVINWGPRPWLTQQTPTQALDTAHDNTSDEALRVLLEGRTATEHIQAIDLDRADVPPIPTSWRRARPPAPSMQLVGAGLDLYGLRSIPMVGRQSHRNHLWSQLQLTEEDQQARVVVLTGSAGMGKSRLARWLCERAHETGTATVLQATHSPIPGPVDGLPRMISRQLRCVGLERKPLAARTERLLRKQGITDPYEWRGLTQLMAPASAEDQLEGEAFEFGSSAERHALIWRHLERHRRARTVIVWLDDVQWGLDALALVEHILTQQSRKPAPVLMVLTARSEALAERHNERLLLKRIQNDAHAFTMDLPPLSDQERGALVQELLGLEGDLARQVEERSEGNPLFAIQLVGDWVQRGVLEVAKRGFALKPGEQARLPDDIHQIMGAQIARIIKNHPPQARATLELAAMLGQEFDEGEWLQACRMAGLEPPKGLLEDLMHANLLHPCEMGWAFAHGMCRESLERNAFDRGQGRHGHITCAQMLQKRYRTGTPGIAERIGLHYMAAQDPAQATIHLQHAAKEHTRNGQFTAALEVIDRGEKGLVRLALPPSDDRWGQSALLKAQVLRRQGRLEESKEISKQTERQARKHGWSTLLPRALQNTGDVARIQGDMHQADSIYQLARSLFDSLNNPLGLAEVLFGMADVHCQTGKLQAAEDLFESVWKMYRGMGLSPGMAESLFGMGQVAIQLDDLQKAQDLLQRARAIFEQHGNRIHVTACIKATGDVHRMAGRFEKAQQDYRKALTFFEATGSGDAVHTRMSIGLLHIHQGTHHKARPILQQCLEVFIQTNERDDQGRVHTQLLPCAADANDWQAWDRHLSQATTQLEETGRFDRDIAWPAQLGARIAAQNGQPQRAWAAYLLALEQWIRADQQDRAQEVRQLMNALPKN